MRGTEMMRQSVVITEEGDNQEVQIAYQEIVNGMQEGCLSVEEFIEVVSSLQIDVFSHIQLPTDADTQRSTVIFEGRELWNLLLFSLYFNQVQITFAILNLSSSKMPLSLTAIIRPPRYHEELHISPLARDPSRLLKEKMSEQNVRLLGFYLAMKHRCMESLKMLYSALDQSLDLYDLIEIVLMSIRAFEWVEAYEFILQAPATKRKFNHFRPQDKEEFISLAIVETIFETSHISKTSQKTFKVKTVELLSELPYLRFALLMSPKMFYDNGLMESGLSQIREEDIIVFVYANEQHI
jgi:hypothetical protein